MNPQNTDQQDELASLEAPMTVVEPTNGSQPLATPPSTSGSAKAPKPDKPNLVVRLRIWVASHLNIYLLLFLILLGASGAGGAVLYVRSSAVQNDIISQSLPQNTLDQLATSDVSVGEPQHTLSVESNTTFSGNVLVRKNLQIAGNLQVGSNLALAGLRVTGNSTFDDVQITQSLALTGNGSIQGQLNVQKGLSVNGGGTFLGAVSAPILTATTLNLNGDLNLTHHIAAGGGTPSRANGSALGAGGTASVSGSDTAGTVTINTGGSPTSGCFVTVTFTTKFNNTPRISLTPVSSAAASISYYATRTASSFSVCTASVPPAGASIIFDYIALD